MKVLKFNISKAKTYKNKEGVEQKQWNNIGTITEFHKDDGTVGRILEIPAIGLEANIFPFKTTEQNKPTQTAQYSGTPNTVIEHNEEVKVDDIPF